jgi:hypothetical protein
MWCISSLLSNCLEIRKTCGGKDLLDANWLFHFLYNVCSKLF